MNRHQLAIDVDNPERGATLVEYVLLMSLIVLVCLASVTAFGDSVSGKMDGSASRIVTASGGTYGP